MNTSHLHKIISESINNVLESDKILNYLNKKCSKIKGFEIAKYSDEVDEWDDISALLSDYPEGKAYVLSFVNNLTYQDSSYISEIIDDCGLNIMDTCHYFHKFYIIAE